MILKRQPVGSGHTAGECESPGSMLKVSRWRRYASLWPLAAASALRAPLSARGRPHALRKAGLTRRLGAALEAGHQRRDAPTTSTADERYRMRPENAASQTEAAGRVALPLVNSSTTERGLTAPDSAGRGGGGRSSTNAGDLGHTLLRFPLSPRTPQKGDPHPALAPCPTNPISGSFFDWKMLPRAAPPVLDKPSPDVHPDTSIREYL